MDINQNRTKGLLEREPLAIDDSRGREFANFVAVPLLTDLRVMYVKAADAEPQIYKLTGICSWFLIHIQVELVCIWVHQSTSCLKGLFNRSRQLRCNNSASSKIIHTCSCDKIARIRLLLSLFLFLKSQGSCFDPI